MKAPYTDNADCRGSWIHAETDNPECSSGSNAYACENFAELGLGVWQVMAAASEATASSL